MILNLKSLIHGHLIGKYTLMIVVLRHKRCFADRIEIEPVQTKLSRILN